MKKKLTNKVTIDYHDKSVIAIGHVADKHDHSMNVLVSDGTLTSIKFMLDIPKEEEISLFLDIDSYVVIH